MNSYYIEFFSLDDMVVYRKLNRLPHAAKVVTITVKDRNNEDELLYSSGIISSPAELKKEIERVIRITELGWSVFEGTFEYFKEVLLKSQMSRMFEIPQN